MSAELLDVSVGARLRYQGDVWTVAEHDGTTVLLRSGDQFRRVHPPSLVGLAQPLEDSARGDEPPADLDADVLGRLTAAQRRNIEAEAQVIEDLVLAPSDVPLGQRYQLAGARLGRSARTAQRRSNRYTQQGLVGLVDARRLKPPRRAVAPGWDQVCLEVLGSFTDRSAPTMITVLRETNARYLERNPGADLPSKSVAYRRLRELDRGRHTFGAAKQRRPAGRPQGVSGRLRADRPGQYVVLDTARLDVFVVEPVTDRRLNTELTVAMDLYSRCVLGLAVRAESTTAQDAAAVISQVVTPQQWGPARGGETPAPYVGFPENLITSALPDTAVGRPRRGPPVAAHPGRVPPPGDQRPARPTS